MPSKKLITKKVEFSASHRLWNNNLSKEENYQLFGKSSSPKGHGHNFTLEVTVEGEIDNKTGMIINLFDLKKIIDKVLVDFDHKNLNKDSIYFKNVIPTSENISKVLWDLIDKETNKIDNCKLHKIRLHETDDLFVDYWRD